LNSLSPRAGLNPLSLSKKNLSAVKTGGFREIIEETPLKEEEDQFQKTAGMVGLQ